MGHRRRRQLGIAFLLGIICTALLSSFGQFGLNRAQAVTTGFAGHWAEPCVQSLVSQQVFDQRTVNSRYPSSLLTQAEFANAVLKAFPGAFASANEALGLTFDEASSETEALLIAALGAGCSLAAGCRSGSGTGHSDFRFSYALSSRCHPHALCDVSRCALNSPQCPRGRSSGVSGWLCR